MKKSLKIIISMMLFSSLSWADEIQFPEEELSQETVLPKFDQNVSVKNRMVITDGKFELGGYYGWNVTEPIRNQSKFGANIGYHWNEESALMINYAKWMSGLNTLYTDGLKDTYRLDFERSPKLNYSLYAHYEWKVFYGKMSITKSSVAHLSTYPILGLGYTAYEHKNYPGFDFGIGQKFYLGKAFAIRADFKFQYSQYPSPFLGDTTPPTTDGSSIKDTNPAPALNEFPEKWGLNTVLDIGMSFLF